jgi:hypothetical protein
MPLLVLTGCGAGVYTAAMHVQGAEPPLIMEMENVLDSFLLWERPWYNPETMGREIVLRLQSDPCYRHEMTNEIFGHARAGLKVKLKLYQRKGLVALCERLGKLKDPARNLTPFEFVRYAKVSSLIQDELFRGLDMDKDYPIGVYRRAAIALTRMIPERKPRETP